MSCLPAAPRAAEHPVSGAQDAYAHIAAGCRRVFVIRIRPIVGPGIAPAPAGAKAPAAATPPPAVPTAAAAMPVLGGCNGGCDNHAAGEERQCREKRCELRHRLTSDVAPIARL